MIKSLKEQTAFVIDRCDTLRLAESTDVFVAVSANWLVACITRYSGISVNGKKSKWWLAERIKRPYTARLLLLMLVNGAHSMAIELSKNYQPSPKEEYMSPKQLEYFRQMLLTWRAELLQESENTISHLKEENWQEPDINDRATLETDAALELRTRDRYRKLVNKIDSALSRVADGSYGYCDDTGEEIGLSRLDARPIATLTVEAQEKHERLEKQRRDD